LQGKFHLQSSRQLQNCTQLQHSLQVVMNFPFIFSLARKTRRKILMLRLHGSFFSRKLIVATVNDSTENEVVNDVNFTTEDLLMVQSTLETLTHISQRRPHQINFQIPSVVASHVFIKCRLSLSMVQTKKSEKVRRGCERETEKLQNEIESAGNFVINVCLRQVSLDLKFIKENCVENCQCSMSSF
jgi:hypothetical protein